MIKALQALQRTETQWNILIDQIFHLEDVMANMRSNERRFKPSFVKQKNPFTRIFYNPVIGKNSKVQWSVFVEQIR